MRRRRDRAGGCVRRSHPTPAGGVAALTLQFYVYGAWVTSDGFVPSPLGSDPVPTWEKVNAWILQPLFTISALATLGWVVRGCYGSAG